MARGEAARRVATSVSARGALESVCEYRGTEGESQLRCTANAYLEKIMETILT
jgi:hypothetical protein